MKVAPDWTNIRHDWALGELSLRQIAEPYDITEGAIRKRAKTEGWPARDLRTRIAAKAEAIVQRQAAEEARGTAKAATEAQIVTANAEQVALIRKAHRVQLESLRKLCDTLKAELDAASVEKEGQKALALTARIDAGKKLVEMSGRAIQLEREAYSMDIYVEPEAPKASVDVMDIARRAAFVLMQAAQQNDAAPSVH